MIVVSTIKGGYLEYFFNVYGIILSNVILRSTLMSEFVDFGGFARISKIGADNNIVKKELKFDYINNIQAKARLKREIESLRLFDSNRIVKLLDYDSENYSWYTMPFYKSNLETFCNNIEIEENLIINIAKNILEAMSVIESRNMVHRDLKPNNILLNSIEDLVICDFGLTKMQRDTVLTRSLQGMGTDYYSAPEQLENAKNVDIRADIFSFGRILIWLFTKNRTYDINHNLIPMKFRSLIKKCVELNPEQRYKSVRELTSAFEQRISKDNLFNRKQILDQITVDSESYINFLSISDLELNRYSEEEFYKIITQGKLQRWLIEDFESFDKIYNLWEIKRDSVYRRKNYYPAKSADSIALNFEKYILDVEIPINVRFSLYRKLIHHWGNRFYVMDILFEIISVGKSDDEFLTFLLDSLSEEDIDCLRHSYKQVGNHHDNISPYFIRILEG